MGFRSSPGGPAWRKFLTSARATIPATGMSEDCLRLNVWTNGFGHNDKRPVMLWLHGGGYTRNGSYTMYDGANLARKRDVVTVTINHRLNTFGFLHSRARRREI